MDASGLQAAILAIAGPRTGGRRPLAMTKRLGRYVKRVNTDEIVIHPHDVEMLETICRRIDDEQDRDQAWQLATRLVDSGLYSRPAEIDQLQSAVSQNIHAFTIGYVNLKTDDLELATGVLVSIDDRVFLATTAHSIPNKPNGKLSFVGKGIGTLSDNTADILDYSKDDEDLRDVGFLELEPTFLGRFGKSAITLSRIFPCGTGQPRHWTMVAGYPAKMTSDIGADTKLFTGHCWNFTILPPEKWSSLPATRGHRPPNEELDVFIPYPREEKVINALTRRTETLVEPAGMSGGGYWQPDNPPSTGHLWTPERYKVIAIQSRWWCRGRYLQGTQIIHWLQLLWDRRVELRASLAEAFPRLAVQS